MKAINVVEAALFSAGRAISVKEIMEETELSEAAVKKSIKELKAAYEDRDTVLEITKGGTKWAMQVRRQAAEPAAKFAQMEIAPKLLKTLALIAYHQPIKQSDLKDMIGAKVYDHIPELKDRGLVKTRRDGQTKILSTTPRFPEYFGLDAASPDQIRATMAKMVGMEAPKKQKEKGLTEFASSDANTPTPEPSAQNVEETV